MNKDLQKLEFIQTELNRLRGYFNAGPKGIELPKQYFKQLTKAVEVLDETAFELFDAISQTDNKADHYKARVIMNKLFKQ